MFRELLGAVILGGVLLHATSVQAFFCIQWAQGRCVYWANSRATMRAFLGTPGAALINGTSTWDQNVFSAANDWNAVGAIQFTVDSSGSFIDPCGARNGTTHICDNTGAIGDNPIYFASSFCGQSFGDVIELTNNCWNANNGQMFNAPVFVNANVLWNAYDGAVRFSGGRPIYDIRRVLLHELGHALGLDHPDDHAQTVEAIMNSRVSNIDRLQADDMNGARTIYSSIPDQGGASVGTSGCDLQATGSAGNLWPLLLGFLPVAFQRLRSRPNRGTRQDVPPAR